MRCCICASDCKAFTTNLRKREEPNMRPRLKRLIFIAPLAILGMLLFIAIGGELVLHLWNWLLPPLFGWRQITFWQALGMLLLCRILFGGLGLHGSGRSSFRRRMEERCEHMTPEERERFRQRFRNCSEYHGARATVSYQYRLRSDLLRRPCSTTHSALCDPQASKSGPCRACGILEARICLDVGSYDAQSF